MFRRSLWLSVAAYAAVLVLSAPFLPGRVPSHFAAGGEADSYTDRGDALLVFAAIGLAMLFLTVACSYALVSGSTRWINVPHADYWKRPEHEAELRSNVAEDIGEIMAATFWLLTAMLVCTFWAARSAEPRLGLTFFIAFGAYLAYVVFVTAVRNPRRYRRRGDSGG